MFFGIFALQRPLMGKVKKCYDIIFLYIHFYTPLTIFNAIGLLKSRNLGGINYYPIWLKNGANMDPPRSEGGVWKFVPHHFRIDRTYLEPKQSKNQFSQKNPTGLHTIPHYEGYASNIKIFMNEYQTRIIFRLITSH